MNNILGFAPIANKQAKILILGSMPSEVSLLRQQYYGHQRNAFWPIMMSLFNKTLDAERTTYEQRKLMLLENNIAVWDVLQSCYREGSLDAAIKMDSIKPNDFHTFLALQSNIRLVCFNGGKAEALYNKYVLPHIKDEFEYLAYLKLPSTSPAYAAMTVQKKISIWSNSLKAGCTAYNETNKSS